MVNRRQHLYAGLGAKFKVRELLVQVTDYRRVWTIDQLEVQAVCASFATIGDQEIMVRPQFREINAKLRQGLLALFFF
jgi:hypothetical protein